MTYPDFLIRTMLSDDMVICLYRYGSRVYGTSNEHSDHDFICVVRVKLFENFSDELINVAFYTSEEFQEQLIKHEISFIECFFLPAAHILKEGINFQYKLSLTTLRHSLSAKSSNSWVKCKKKLTVQESFDLKTGLKSMFHSFRIYMFGIQLCKTGRIHDYSQANSLYKEIMEYKDWDTLLSDFKRRYNELASEFKEYAPKKLE